MIRYDALPKSRRAQERYDPAQRRAQPRRAEGLTGYRHDQAAHEAARELVDAERRREIASAGGQARAARYRTAGDRHEVRQRLDRIRAVLTAQEPAPHTIAARQRPDTRPTAAPSPAERKAAAARRAAASRPARRAAQRARKAAEKAARRKP
jgi:hypothetical protein